MNSINTPKELLAKLGIEYDSLPVFPESKKIEYIVKNIALSIFKMTIIGAFAIFALTISAENIIRFTNLYDAELTPLGKQRLQETEEKIRSIAKKAGIGDTQNLKLLIKKSFEPSTIGTSTFVLSPEYLVKPEDLPAELNFARLDNHELSEEEWVVHFDQWVKTSILINNQESPKPSCQLDVDRFIESGKSFLKLYRDQVIYEKTFEAIVGHELGHCYHKHRFKKALAELGWDLLALPTLGISTIFHDKVLSPLKKKQEIEADLFSQSKFGAEGLIRFFKEQGNVRKILRTKYPHICDENGDKHNHTHPLFSERIAYLNR